MPTNLVFCLITEGAWTVHGIGQSDRTGAGERSDRSGRIRQIILVLCTLKLGTAHRLCSMSSFVQANADDVAIATIRTLAVDVVGKANSGHPGKSLLSNQVFIA
jgi:hypothetical protein